ncbi:hypothetical protein ACP70R_033652 [Stipagrostis hirtigluma subsp. patula]
MTLIARTRRLGPGHSAKSPPATPVRAGAPPGAGLRSPATGERGSARAAGTPPSTPRVGGVPHASGATTRGGGGSVRPAGTRPSTTRVGGGAHASGATARGGGGSARAAGTRPPTPVPQPSGGTTATNAGGVVPPPRAPTPTSGGGGGQLTSGPLPRIPGRPRLAADSIPDPPAPCQVHDVDCHANQGQQVLHMNWNVTTGPPPLISISPSSSAVSTIEATVLPIVGFFVTTFNVALPIMFLLLHGDINLVCSIWNRPSIEISLVANIIGLLYAVALKEKPIDMIITYTACIMANLFYLMVLYTVEKRIKRGCAVLPSTLLCIGLAVWISQIEMSKIYWIILRWAFGGLGAIILFGCHALQIRDLYCATEVIQLNAVLISVLPSLLLSGMQLWINVRLHKDQKFEMGCCAVNIIFYVVELILISRFLHNLKKAVPKLAFQIYNSFKRGISDERSTDEDFALDKRGGGGGNMRFIPKLMLHVMAAYYESELLARICMLPTTITRSLNEVVMSRAYQNRLIGGITGRGEAETVFYALFVGAELDGLTNLQPHCGCDDPNFPYYFKLQCENCRETTSKATCVSLSEVVDLPTVHGSANLVQKESCFSLGPVVLPASSLVEFVPSWLREREPSESIVVCKLCGRDGTIVMIPGQGTPLTIEQSQKGEKTCLMVFDCRGYEPFDIEFHDGWKAESVGGTPFDIDCSEDEFAEYDAKGGCFVGLRKLQSTFEVVKKIERAGKIRYM